MQIFLVFKKCFVFKLTELFYFVSYCVRQRTSSNAVAFENFGLFIDTNLPPGKFFRMRKNDTIECSLRVYSVNYPYIIRLR